MCRCRLPRQIAELTQQRECPFGDAALQFLDAVLAAETCEELFTPMAPNIRLALSGAACARWSCLSAAVRCASKAAATLCCASRRRVAIDAKHVRNDAGVDIIANGSGSHHQLRKLDQRMELMRSATTKAGGVYLYANQQGCDGGRVYYDGCASVLVNGKLVEQASQFSLKVCASRSTPCRAPPTWQTTQHAHALGTQPPLRSYRMPVVSRPVDGLSIDGTAMNTAEHACRTWRR